MVWREPWSHLGDWCFGITNTSGFSGKSEHQIEYPNTPSALRPVPRDNSMPVPEPPENFTLDSETESEEASPEARPSTREDQDFSVYSTKQPLDHSGWHERPGSGLDLPTTDAQLRYQQWKLLQKGVKE
jgi:hypothetical protein